MTFYGNYFFDFNDMFGFQIRKIYNYTDYDKNIGTISRRLFIDFSILYLFRIVRLVRNNT